MHQKENYYDNGKKDKNVTLKKIKPQLTSAQNRIKPFILDLERSIAKHCTAPSKEKASNT